MLHHRDRLGRNLLLHNRVKRRFRRVRRSNRNLKRDRPSNKRPRSYTIRMHRQPIKSPARLRRPLSNSVHHSHRRIANDAGLRRGHGSRVCRAGRWVEAVLEAVFVLFAAVALYVPDAAFGVDAWWRTVLGEAKGEAGVAEVETGVGGEGPDDAAFLEWVELGERQPAEEGEGDEEAHVVLLGMLRRVL